MFVCNDSCFLPPGAIQVSSGNERCGRLCSGRSVRKVCTRQQRSSDTFFKVYWGKERRTTTRAETERRHEPVGVSRIDWSSTNNVDLQPCFEDAPSSLGSVTKSGLRQAAFHVILVQIRRKRNIKRKCRATSMNADRHVVYLLSCGLIWKRHGGVKL